MRFVCLAVLALLTLSACIFAPAHGFHDDGPRYHHS